MLQKVEPAADIVREIVADATTALRQHSANLIHENRG
jgi:hypothetical protein